ncbi:MAG TPA: 3-deoxy-7-phosphoheptulonate synthase [Actinobacteria bacterium]|nr:3-deoxy-7-phosphoheptulonate synthase [Actinomycetota bacterium]
MTDEPILKSRRRPDVDTTVVAVGAVRFGDGSYPVVAGPVAVESEEQLDAVATAVAAAGGAVLRAGTFVGSPSPYGFRGLGKEALYLLEHAGRRAGLPTATEVVEPGVAELVAEHVDLLEIGPAQMQDFALLSAVGAVGKPVILHRGPSATVDEWLFAAEYILAQDNHDVILCERGSRGFDPRTSDTVEISAVPVVQRLTHLPVIVDPAPTSGAADLMGPLALAARAVGADGLIVRVHPDPVNARAGNGDQIDLDGFADLMAGLGIPALRDEIDRLDRELLRIVAERVRHATDIGRIKARRNMALRSPDREAELLEEVRRDAGDVGLDPDFAVELMELILAHSRSEQRRAVGRDAADGAA